MLTEVVQVNGSLRPAVFPWAPQAAKVQTHGATSPAPSAGAEQDVLADKVLERVQAKLALILPEMMRTAVDEVLNEYLKDSSHNASTHQPR